MPQNWESCTTPHPQHAFWDSLAQDESSLGYKTFDMNLEDRQISKQVHSSLTYPKKDISMRKTALVSSRFVIKSSSCGTRCHHNTKKKPPLILRREGKNRICHSQFIPPATWGPLASLLMLSFSHFLLGELYCQGKGAVFSFHNCFWAGKGCCP